jgi:MoaA/NifB/PqqE/SkfB family radical SAM enzyme
MEGDIVNTDRRRGKGVYEKLVRAMHDLKEKKIFFGCSVTVGKGNLDEVISRDFMDTLYHAGCKAVFFIEYVPMKKDENIDALDDNGRRILAEGIEKLYDIYKDMILISFPGDEKHLGGCLAAGRGFFHISVTGDAEPCPFSPFSDVNLKDKTLLEALSSPLFKKLRDSGMMSEEHIGGCLLHEKEEDVKNLFRRS